MSLSLKPKLLSLILLLLTSPTIIPVTGNQVDIDQFGHYDGAGGLKTQGRCEVVTIPMCKDMPYNETFWPNLMGQATQEEAGYEVHQYYALVKLQCSPALKAFICTLFVPICTALQQALPPCRSLCETARTGCEHVMMTFGFAWPENLECSKFPPNHELCVNGDISPGSTVDLTPPKNPYLTDPTYRSSFEPAKLPAVGKGLTCPVDWHVPEHSIADELHDCGIPCNLFSDKEKQIASIVVIIVAALTLISSMFTINTALLDPTRFQYPERAIVHLAVCYALLAVGYIVGGLWSSEINCHDEFLVFGPGMASCSLVFMFVYFCTMASHIWWVLLSFTWYLSAGLKWGGEAIAAYSLYFHLSAWGLSAFLAMAAVALQYAEGDPLGGPCALGMQRSNQLQYFMLYPLLTLLSIGTLFFILGFLALFRIRRAIKRSSTITSTTEMISAGGQRSLLWDQQHETNLVARSGAARLELLMARIGVFSILYTVPAAVFLGSLFYLSTPTAPNGVLTSIIGSSRLKRDNQMLFVVLLVRYISNLCFGSALVFWFGVRKH